MRKFFALAAAFAVAMPMWATEPENNSEFASEETLESGFLTTALNSAIAGAMETPAAAPAAAPEKTMEYGRTVTDFVSAPKFGGYFIGKYAYNDQDMSATRGGGFSQRLVRFYVDGTILKDFAYRIQLQTNNASFHMKDFFVEWRKYKFAMIKIGQFKRAFGFENPMNPWDISTGDYSLMTKKMTGHDDYTGLDNGSNGGRDQGIQVQGDFLPIGKDQHNLFHYQVMVSNGTGINSADNDAKKDITATLQVQPIKGLFLGVFGWKGTAKKNNLDYSRNRYAFGLKYDNKGYTLRSEYAHGQSNDGVNANHNADSWYVVGGMPITNWFKLSAEYQCYRNNKSWTTAQNIYSLIPSFQLHKNLMFQVQYNWNDNRGAKDKHYNELWLETYVRF